MLRRITLVIFAIAAAAMSAGAADLPVQSPLGAVFADPPPVYQTPVTAYGAYAYTTVYAPRWTSDLWSPAITASRIPIFTARITAGRSTGILPACLMPAAFMAIAEGGPAPTRKTALGQPPRRDGNFFGANVN